ncbi:histidinol-phosphate aminotransferase [Pseudonocardia thermophila]|jgi:histidinol-phosphate aminotransferase|uniref:Aromatic amino acid aminotransferase n=1 Tax=Pseudonocardia thermophila TaxID=1848 RepID=A0A1M6SMV5_PSETH|nr:histidinol-phosphate transaminase [Pseudonocardia thermophila]SHK46043.1 histidinol-phosphate aminotransferase [Pseudonocardia thermophila]
MTLIRPDLDTLPAYVPGKSVPGSIKLASNEVALPPLPAVLDAIAEAAAGGNRYPDLAVVALTEKLAQFCDVAPEQVAVGCGSVSLCQQLVSATCRETTDEVVFAWRSFEAYPIVTQIGGAVARTVPLDAEFRHDLDAMAAAVGPNTRLVFVCSPNNPTGPAVTDAEMRRFLAAVGPDVVVALDEAYFEFVTDPAAVNGRTLLDEHPNLVVLRTFSKAYRLAGFRVGYALGAPPVITALRKVCSPFSVSIPAQAAAIAAIEHSAELLAALPPIIEERTRVREALLAAGYTVPVTQANFVWLPLGDAAVPFAQHCMDQKVVVRPFPGDGVRVTVTGQEENDAFLAAATSFQA